MFEKQSPKFDVTLALMSFRIIYAGRASLWRLVTIKQIDIIVLRFANKMQSFNFKTSSLKKSWELH